MKVVQLPLVQQVCLLLLFVEFSCAFNWWPRRRPDPPNIIFIMVDDLGWHDVSYNVPEGEATDFTTPNIDRLANSGVKLSQYYTHAICTPTRVALLTGRQPLELGMHQGVNKPGTTSGIPLDMPVLPEHMKNLGYDTYMAGKWHVGYSQVEQTPVGRGFDEFVGSLGGAKNFFTHDTDVTGSGFAGGFGATCDCDDDPLTSNFTTERENGYDLWHADARSKTFKSIADENEGVYDTDVVTNFLLEKIRKKGRNPLFLYGAYTAPHDPWQSPRRFSDLPECAAIDDPDRRQLCGMMKSVDDALGRIMRALKRKGIDDETLLIFSSDNGAATVVPYDFSLPTVGSNWPYRGGKSMLFEGGPKVPGFLWGEPVLKGSSGLRPRGKTYEHVFNVADWSLTLQEAAGADLEDPTYYGPNVNGATQLSSVSHWDALKRLSAKRPNSWLRRWFCRWFWCPKPEPTPPRGERQLMLYNVDPPQAGPVTSGAPALPPPTSGAVRNSVYKLYRTGVNRFFDGYFDPSNTSREDIICGSPIDCFPPGLPPKWQAPPAMLFNLRDDPLEMNPINVTGPDLSHLNSEELESYHELSDYMDYWIAASEPPQIAAFFQLDIAECDAAPVLHDCSWGPWRNSDDPHFDLEEFGIDTTQTCRANNGKADEECPSARTAEWPLFA